MIGGPDEEPIPHPVVVILVCDRDCGFFAGIPGGVVVSLLALYRAF